MKNFRNYEVWKDGVAFSAQVYQLTEQFPKKEMYALCDQLQRASVSILLGKTNLSKFQKMLWQAMSHRP